MKILILANYDVGLYKFRKELIQELLKGHEVYISLPKGNLVQPLVDMGCIFIDTPVDRRGINPITDLSLMKFYRKILKEIQPDKVITYTIKPNIYGSLMCRMLKIPYYVNITGLGTAFQKDNWLKKLVTMMYKVALKKVKVVFFENQGNLDIFVDLHIVKRDKTCRLNGAGVNLEDYPFQPYPKHQGTKFLFIGRVMKEKGVDELFYAAGKLKKEYPEVSIDLIGQMEDSYEERLNHLTKEGIVQYYGFQEDVKPFIQDCDCFVLPSYHEGMANTLLECAAMGRPLITSNIHGCLEAIDENGFLVNVQDQEELYIKMKMFIELPYEQKVQMGKNSRKHMEEVFDKKKVVKNTIEALLK